MVNLNATILSLCAQYGLEFIGIVAPRVSEDDERALSTWLSQGWHGDMEFMQRLQEARVNPDAVLPGVKSIICVAWQYEHADFKSCGDCLPIAKYAKFRDYHRHMKRRMEQIILALKEDFQALKDAEFRVTVDSAPVLERALAKNGERGFIGKNTCYIHPSKGSFLLLGEIHATADLAKSVSTQVDPKLRTDEGGCGTCRRCQVHCPTGALDHDYRLDAKRCLAYWTIEHRGVIPTEFWQWLPRSIFGCDICQDVCPYNRNVSSATTENLSELRRHVHLSLFEMATMTQETYVSVFGGTPMTRAKKDGLRRNALIAMAVTRDDRLAEALEKARQDLDPVLRQTAAQIDEWQAE